MNAGLLFLYPNYIALNAAIAHRVRYAEVSIGSALADKVRYFIAAASVGAFAVVLFALDRPLAALILGFAISSAFVVRDYRTLFRQARGLALNDADVRP